MHAKAIGLTMGLYISGNALGGMSGRLVTGAVSDLSSWRVAIAGIGAIFVVYLVGSASSAWVAIWPEGSAGARCSGSRSLSRSLENIELLKELEDHIASAVDIAKRHSLMPDFRPTR